MGSGPLLRVASVIDYGRMVIGERRYICPVRSLALTEAQDSSNFGSPAVATDPYTGVNTIVQVNETLFTDYHRLGSTTRILTYGQAPPAQAPSHAEATTPASHP